MSEEYGGPQWVGIDLHRRRSVIVRMTDEGETLESIRILNDPERLRSVLARAGEAPEVVMEATYGWYWAADTITGTGAQLHDQKVAAEDVTPLADRLRPGHVGSLQDLSSELAAAALTDLFLRRGYAQARVSDPARVRQLARVDCRRRGCRVRTLGSHGVVVLHDEERHAAFLATPEGTAYEEEMERRVMASLPSYEYRPELRLVTPADRDDLS